MKLRQHADFAGYEARNKKEHVLGADPSLTAADGGRTWWRSDNGQFRGWDGAAAQTLTNIIESIVGDGTISPALVGKQVTISIPAASGTVRGTLAAADKAKLDASTNGNTPNTLVQRDASGNFSAGTITAALAGLAADSTLHGGQTLAQVRDFSLTTGQRTALSAISDFNTAARLNRLDQFAVPQASVDFNAQRLINGADPLNPQDLATKNYVDSVATGLDPKASVKYATTTALPTVVYANGASGVGATLTASANGAIGAIGGGTPVLNDRILVKNQATAGQNGLYRVSDVGSAGTPWILTRATDADQAAEVSGGLFTFVETGTLAATGWVLNATGVITIGTTAQNFQQFSGAGTYLNGNGLSLTGSTFAVVGTAGRILVSGAGVDIDSAYVGQASITTLGTIGTGTWNATTIAVAKGGTGATTPAGARTNLGATTKYAADLPAGTTLVVNHALGTTDLIVLVFEKSSGDVVITDVNITDANNITIGFGSAVAANAYRVVVVG